MRTSTRTIKVLGALVAGITVVSGVLLAIEPGPAFRPSNLSFSAFDSDASVTGPEALLFDTAPSPAGGWKAIVIRDSRGVAGGQAELDEAFRHAGRATGSGHHFVIRKDGARIEVCERWRAQAPGTTFSGAGADEWNKSTVSICLVGDADKKPFDQAQLNELAWLVKKLQAHYHVPAAKVYAQMGAADKAGRYLGGQFPAAAFRAQLAK